MLSTRSAHEMLAEAKRQRPQVDPGPPVSELEFTGCVARHMSFDDLVAYEGRLEVWDAESETAWICEDGGDSTTHESPGAILPMLLAWVAGVRGKPIRCVGTASMVVRDPTGKRLRMMQPDQCVYLYHKGLDVPQHFIEVGEHNLPNVILEVDNTTDIRRGKLALYEAWGLPELWVEVPDTPFPNRPRSLRPGLTIHVLEAGRYRESAVSRAFPSWTADEIHWAFNEETMSPRTLAALRRVGEVMGERTGTGPQDHPLFRWQRDEGRTEGVIQGHAKGLAEGHERGLAEGHERGLAEGHQRGLAEGHERGLAEGHERGLAEGVIEGQARIVRQLMASRGIEVSPGFPAELARFRRYPVGRDPTRGPDLPFRSRVRRAPAIPVAPQHRRRSWNTLSEGCDADVQGTSTRVSRALVRRAVGAGLAPRPSS